MNNKLFIIIFILITIGILYLSNNHLNIDKYNNNFSDCREPNFNNPFGNYLITDISANPNHKICKNFNDDDIYNLFNINLYTNSNPSRIFSNKSTSYRYFITLPVTNYPNNQKEFGNYLYNNNKQPSCKNKAQRYCLNYQDLRFSRRNF